MIYRCPRTNMNVQTWIADDASDPQRDYETVTCPACTQLHFVNKSNGRLYGDDDD